MLLFDHILTGHEATEQNAIDHAKGLDWGQVDVSEQAPLFMDYFDTFNGVDIYYCYGSDSYYFGIPEN